MPRGVWWSSCTESQHYTLRGDPIQTHGQPVAALPVKTRINSPALLIFALLGALACGGCGKREPSSAEIRQFLNSHAAGAPYQVTEVKTEAFPVEADKLKVKFQATGKLTEPFFSTIDLTSFAQAQNWPIDPERVQKARTLTSGPQGERLLQLARITPPPGLDAVTVLKQSAPSGYNFTFEGEILAERKVDSWNLTLNEFSLQAALPGNLGRPRRDFGQSAYDTGNPADVQRMRDAVTANMDFADRIEKAKAAYDAEVAAARAKRLAEFLQLVAPGRILAGSQIDGQRTDSLSIEILSVDQEHKHLEAVLRNDGGWAEARRIEGSWSADDDTGAITLALSSKAADAVPNAGPYNFVGWAGNWTIHLEAFTNRLAGDDGGKTYRFVGLSDEGAKLLRDQVEGTARALLELMHPGARFRGRIDSALGATPVALRIESISGASVQAVLICEGHPDWRRRLSGVIASNRYGSEGLPIRFTTDPQDRIDQPNLPYLLKDPLMEAQEFRLKFEGGQLLGEWRGERLVLTPIEDQGAR